MSARVIAYYFKQFPEQKQINKHKSSTGRLDAGWCSDAEVAEADETMTCPLLLMRERSVEWAWFNQCDVTLSHSLLAALLVAVCLLVVHVTSVTRSVHDSPSSLISCL